MDIEELKERRDHMDTEITNILKKFKDDTGVTVAKIELTIYAHTSYGKEPRETKNVLMGVTTLLDL